MDGGRSFTNEETLHIRRPDDSTFDSTMLDLLTQNGLTRVGEISYTESCNRESFLAALKLHLKLGNKRQLTSIRFYKWLENTSDPNFKGAELVYTAYGARLIIKTTRLVLEFVLTGPFYKSDKFIITCKVQYHCLACNDIKFSSDYCVKHFLEKEAKSDKN